MRTIKLISILLLLAGICAGCSDKPELQDEPGWKKVCTKWGTPEDKVRKLMRTYTLKGSTSSTLTYKGKGIVEAVSYQFAEDSLCAVVVVMNAVSVDKQDIRSSFSSHESLGEINSSEIFVRYVKDELVTVTSYTMNENEYISVGYADLGDAEMEKQEE